MTTTFIGRFMIQRTKEICESSTEICKCEVVYGDTDSVFIRYKDNPPLEEAFRHCGDLLANTTHFGGAIAWRMKSTTTRSTS